MVKIFTMVKGENDIVRDWVNYHGKLFGYSNIYVIDNMSKDGTFEILNEFKGKIHIYRATDYKKKGEYLQQLIRTNCRPNELAFPIDIDEFIVQYTKNTNTISCNPDIIRQRVFSIASKNQPDTLYKMNYIFGKVIAPEGYDRAAAQMEVGSYGDYGEQAKSFFHAKYLSTHSLDHGNHMHSNHFVLTDLCLIHYHHRNKPQMCKKIFNNILGLGYNPYSINALRTVTSNSIGLHHVQAQISILEGKYTFPVSTPNNDDINLQEMSVALQ